jgi:hypothetical protein
MASDRCQQSPLTAPLAEAQGVPSGPSTLPVSLVGRSALVWVRPDFRADALRHEAYPCFGARPAPLSRVAVLALVLPAGAPPHLPNTARIGHKRDDSLGLRGR